MCQQEMRACESVAMSECESVGYVNDQLSAEFGKQGTQVP